MEELIIKKIDDLKEYESVLHIREEVFVKEQNVPESLENDGEFENAIYFIAYINGKAQATGRLSTQKTYIKFERIATLVDSRGKGIGKKLLLFMQEYSSKNYPKKLQFMNSQLSAVDFYLKLNWIKVGDIFYVADIPHQCMINPPNSQKELLNLTIRNDKDDSINNVIEKLII